MKRKDDSEQLYKTVTSFDSILFALFEINTIAAAIVSFTTPVLSEFLFWVQCITAIGYVLLAFGVDCWLWFYAEKSRRLDCIANGFRVDLSERKTDGYYDNALPPSVQRYAANNFESAFYTKSIAQNMIPGLLIKTFVVLAVFAFSLRSVADANKVLLVVQTCFSSVFFTNQLLVLVFCKRVEDVYDQFYTALITDGLSDTPQYEAKLLSYSIEYETLKAFFKVRLSTKIFERNKIDLNKRWQEIAKHLYIADEPEKAAPTPDKVR